MAAKFLGEPTKVITGSHDRTLKIWDLRSRMCTYVPLLIFQLYCYLTIVYYIVVVSKVLNRLTNMFLYQNPLHRVVRGLIHKEANISDGTGLSKLNVIKIDIYETRFVY